MMIVRRRLMTHEFRRDAVAITKVLAPVVFVSCVGFIFHDFVFRAISANVAVNVGIIVTAFYCVALILMRLLSAQGDFRVIERFGQEALKGVYMKKLLEEPWLKQKYVRHYLAHIAQTGGVITSQLDQHAIENELHALQNEYESRLELPQFLVGFMIAMGLLGTFIGLLETLTGISSMLDGLTNTGGEVSMQFTKLISELRKPLAGMGIAFSASMFGLICSLMLAMMMTNLRRYINRVMALARNVMHDLIKLSRPSTASTSTPVFYDTRLSGGEEGGVVGGGANSGLLASRIDVLVKKIEFLMKSFEASINGTQKLTDLLGFGPRMKEISEKSLEELKLLGLAHGEQRQLSQKLIDLNTDMAKTLVTVAEMQRQSREIGEKNVEAVKAAAAAQSDHGRLTQKAIDVGVDTGRLIGELIDGQRQIKDVADKRLEAMKSTMSAQSDHARLSQRLIDICSETGRLVGELVDGQRLVREISERSSEGLYSIVSAQSEQGRLLQKIIDVHGDAVRVIEGALEVQRQHGTTHESVLAEIKSTVAIGTEQRQLGQSLVEGVNQTLRIADNSFNIQKSFSGELITAIKGLDERLSKLEEVEVGGARHLWAIKESLTKLSQSMGVVELVSAGIGQQTLLLETLVSEMRVSQASLYAIQQNLRS